MKIIKYEDIEKGLDEQNHLYLCGLLSRHNAVDHYQNDGFEMVLCKFKDYTCEDAHCHPINDEYTLVLEGEIKVYDFNENKEYHFKAGDFFVEPKGTTHKAKAKADTFVLTAKVPGGNDKILEPEIDKLLQNWSASFDSAVNKE